MNTAELARVVEALRSCTFAATSEARLQEALGTQLSTHGITHDREVPLGEAGRIDFLCAGGIGVEVKIDGARSAVIRQLHSYARAEAIRGLILFTTRSKHIFEGDAFNGKPFAIVRSMGWL